MTPTGISQLNTKNVKEIQFFQYENLDSTPKYQPMLMKLTWHTQ